MGGRRGLHYCLKIGDRKATVDFLKRILGMTVLRHEEFEGGCKATCNGPYDLNWSKTMIGYGHEDTNYVLELTFNYGIRSYKHGNEFPGITMTSTSALEKIKESNYPATIEGDYTVVTSPCGYTFRIKEGEGNAITHFTLTCSSLSRSIQFWRDHAKMTEFEVSDRRAVLGFGADQTKLILQEIDGPVDRGTAFGRAAFGCSEAELPGIQSLMEEKEEMILTPLVSLDTPGKATVQVVIVADPDGHEVAFVGDEGFRELSQIDPNGGTLLEDAIKANGGL